MWLNSTSQYAIRAVVHIAEHGADAPVSVASIASALRSPRNYLSKTLHLLARAGVLQSTRGTGGGFQLADPPHRLTLDRIVQPFQQATERRCLMGRAQCGGARPCAAHDRWARVADVADKFFARTTVADLLRKDPAVRIA
jgi:Rrf2 family iron-sulfur cluster assembly transcriptional regulator